MKILLILEYYHPNIGGLEKLFKSLVDQLTEQQHQVTIITNKIAPDQPSVEKFDQTTIHRYNFYNRYLFTLLAFFPAIKLARKCDLIQTTSYNAGLPAYCAGWLTGKKVCITFHEVWLDLWFRLPFFSHVSKWLHYLFERFLLKLPFHHFIAVSEHTKQALLLAGISSTKISRIYNGIDYTALDQYKPDSKLAIEKPFTFLYFGRLGISKGLDVLIKAVKILRDQDSHFQVILILPRKPSKLFKQIQGMMAELKVTSQFIMKHELREDVLFQQVVSADAIVIPSYSEGFCFAAAESVALDKPIISSDQGALKEVVGGKVLTFSHQDPTELAAKMIDAMNGQWQEREKKRFHLSDTVAAYIACYERILQTG